MYDVAHDGITRAQYLQHQLEYTTKEYDKLLAFLTALQNGSDFVATSLLARLRLGANIDELLSSLEATQATLTR